MTRAQLAALLTLGLAGCSTVSAQLGAPPPPPPPPPVEVSSVVGFGAFRTPAGAHGTCAGLSVLLMAETAQTRSRILALYGSQQHAVLPIAQVKARSIKLGPPPASLQSFSTQCDTTGGFSFNDLAPGGYFLIARARVRNLENVQEDLVILQHVSLRTGEAREVRLAE